MKINIDNQNRVHPFYMIYIDMDGEIICNYLNPKKMLDDIRLLCKGKKEPDKELCNEFNKETLDLFLKYNVVSIDSVDKLIKDNKLKIDGIDEVLVKYRKEEK